MTTFKRTRTSTKGKKIVETVHRKTGAKTKTNANANAGKEFAYYQEHLNSLLSHYDGLLKTPDKRLSSRNILKKKAIKYLKTHSFTTPKDPVHPKTGIIRLAIVRTAATKYGGMRSYGDHFYKSKWSNSHTNGGTAIKNTKLKNAKKGYKNVSSWGMN